MLLWGLRGEVALDRFTAISAYYALQDQNGPQALRRPQKDTLYSQIGPISNNSLISPNSGTSLLALIAADWSFDGPGRRLPLIVSI